MGRVKRVVICNLFWSCSNSFYIHACPTKFVLSVIHFLLVSIVSENDEKSLCGNFTVSSSADELLKPQVLKLEALLERDGDTTKLIIPDPQYPEQKVWTNAQDWSKIELLTKGYFKVSGATPAPAYIVADKTKIGVKSVRISSILRRGKKKNDIDVHRWVSATLS